MARDLLADGTHDRKAVAAARRELALCATQLKEKFMRAGLLQTYRQMDRTTRMIGYEIAALETGTWPVMDLHFLDIL